MKLGVSSYSFNRLVTGGQMNSQLDVIAKAKASGFEVIESHGRSVVYEITGNKKIDILVKGRLLRQTSHKN